MLGVAQHQVAANLEPQSRQNLAPAGFSVPQLRHFFMAGLVAAPQSGQNLAEDGTEEPQAGQLTVVLGTADRPTGGLVEADEPATCCSIRLRTLG